MTTSKDRADDTNDRDSRAPDEKRDAGPALEAEIVRDLEAEDQADAVRGGACPTSRPV